MKRCYIDKMFRRDAEEMIHRANDIIRRWRAKGFVLTLRQLYYQFVAGGILPNTEKSYKKLGNTIDDGRMAGLIDWEAIVDRSRSLVERSSWNSPEAIISACATSFYLDHWKDQPNMVEVWIEKDALSGVIEDVCHKYGVSHFACRGYSSQSSMWRAGRRFLNAMGDLKEAHVIYLGDHDPSGIDMTRDIETRLSLFAEAPVNVHRIALNMDQVEEFSLPPNPAKLTDSRASGYIEEYGDESWELDALDPTYIVEIVEEKILELMDGDAFDSVEEKQNLERARLGLIATRYDDVCDLVDEGATDSPDGDKSED